MTKKFEFVKRNIFHGKSISTPLIIHIWLKKILDKEYTDLKPWFWKSSVNSDGYDLFFKEEQHYVWFLLRWESELEIAELYEHC